MQTNKWLGRSGFMRLKGTVTRLVAFFQHYFSFSCSSLVVTPTNKISDYFHIVYFTSSWLVSPTCISNFTTGLEINRPLTTGRKCNWRLRSYQSFCWNAFDVLFFAWLALFTHLYQAVRGKRLVRKPYVYRNDKLHLCGTQYSQWLWHMQLQHNY